MKTLEFAVKSIPEGKLDLHKVQVTPKEIDLVVDEIEFSEKVHGTLQLLRRADEVYVEGGFSAVAQMVCRRCAEHFPARIEASIQVQFYPTDEFHQPNPFAEDTGERFYAGDIIDLSDEVRQALVLEIPIWFLCSEACQGLCPQCGENLNVSTCDCVVETHKPSVFGPMAAQLSQLGQDAGSWQKSQTAYERKR